MPVKRKNVKNNTQSKQKRIKTISNSKGLAGSSILWSVILGGLVIVGFLVTGNAIPNQSALDSENQAIVTIIPPNNTETQKSIQMQTFEGVTGIPTPTNTPKPQPTFGLPNSDDPSIATCGSSAGIPAAPVTGYTLKKCEDFDNGFGAYSPYNGGGGSTVVGRGRVASQCSVSNGMLILKQDADGATCGGSMGSFAQRFGYWEVKMRTYTTGRGGSAPHPVLILWPDTEQWSDGELDYVETDIGDPGIGVFLHCVGNPSQNCYHTTYQTDISQWHVYGFEWTADGFKGYVDGQQIYETSGNGSNPNVSMHQTIQLDNLTGRTPVSPGVMEVDWVHMYSK